jgi:hypothetical protein
MRLSDNCRALQTTSDVIEQTAGLVDGVDEQRGPFGFRQAAGRVPPTVGRQLVAVGVQLVDAPPPEVQQARDRCLEDFIAPVPQQLEGQLADECLAVVVGSSGLHDVQEIVGAHDVERPRAGDVLDQMLAEVVVL